MVARPRHILLLLPLLAWAGHVAAQNYSHLDTVSVYPNKGTYYHDRFEGRKTASGEVFDQNRFTAAHWKIKLGTHVLVTNVRTGQQVIVKVNDRCPKHGVLDMTHRAAAAIGIRGCQDVTLRVLPEGYEQQCLSQDALFDSVRSSLYPHVNPPPASPPRPSATTHEEGETYNLLLGHAASHSEAYQRGQRLSVAHRECYRVEPLEGSDSLSMTLDVRLSLGKAQQLQAKMRPYFPAVQVVKVE